MCRPTLLLLLVSSAAAAQAPALAHATAEYDLAQSLERRGLPSSAFDQYARIIQAGPAHPFWLKAVEGAALAARNLHDDVLAPNLLEKAWTEQFLQLPKETQANIHASLALFAYRAGNVEEAAPFVERVPADSQAWPQARYVAGLLQQRLEPEKAVQTFRDLAGMPRAPAELRELASLALGRTLYALKRWPEAGAAYSRLPRFSRHWDEALFEGAYADLRSGDPGGALGRLHSLRSPHLRDEFAPESLNLAAIIFHQRCLYPQVDAALAQFDREYLPMRDQVKKLLAQDLPVEEHWRMLAAEDHRLPPAVQHHLQKNERAAAFGAHLAALDREATRIRGDALLAGSTLGPELLDALARQKELIERLAGKFVRGRLADIARRIDVLEADKELIGFETLKGEKEMLEERFDVNAQLASQTIHRPEMPPKGHEYWPFDGEYWPDEIGYYRYTLKDACPRRQE